MSEPAARAGLQREAFLVVIAGTLLFTLGIWNQPFTGFETRFAVFAQAMWRHGPTLFPTTWGEPYPDYPVTGTWLIWLVAHVFGGVTRLAAVLPTALVAALGLGLTYLLLARHSRHWALLTVCLELLTATFLAEARAISLDQMVATVTVAAFYVAYTAFDDRRPRRLLWLPLLLAVGFAVRGPIGVVIPAGVVCSYYALTRQWRALLVFGAVAAAVLALCWGVLLGLTRAAYGTAFMHEVIRMEVAGRLDTLRHLPVTYYFTSSFGNYALAYPLAVLTLLLGGWRLWQRGDDRGRLLVLLVGWALVVMLGMSVPTFKKARYVLAAVPALAALAAWPFIDDAPTRALRALRNGVEKLFLLLPGLLLIGLALSARRLHHTGVELHLPLAWAAGLLAVVQVFALLVQWRGRGRQRQLGLALAAVAAMWFTNVLVVEPATRALHDTATFVARAEALRAAEPGQLVFFRVARDGAAIKYLVNADPDLKPVFVNAVDALATLPRPAWIVVDEHDAPALLQSPLLAAAVPRYRGDFDHRRYALYFLPATPETPAAKPETEKR